MVTASSGRSRWFVSMRTSASCRYTPGSSHTACGLGQWLYCNGVNCSIGGNRRQSAVNFTAAKSASEARPMRAQCLRHPDRKPVLRVSIFIERQSAAAETSTDRMKRWTDSPRSRQMFTQRFTTEEPVFGKLRHNTVLKRITQRGRTKVDGQCKPYCLVQTLEKLANSGYGG